MTRRAFLQVASLGTYPLPPVVGAECLFGCVLAAGVLTAADHELDDGYFAIGRHPERATTVQLHPKNPRLAVVDGLRDHQVELLIRER